MADMREKLVELFNEAEEHSADVCCFSSTCEDCPGRRYGDKCRDYLKADHLIAHGVTVQEWIPVAERLPEENDYYLCCVKSFCFPGRTYINILACDKNGFKEGHIYTDDVTHWMPLPQPPKGE